MEDEREEMTEYVSEDREEVAEEATAETDTQAVEQRTDDYDGLVRRIEDLADSVKRGFGLIDSRLEALGLTATESAGFVDESIKPEQVAEDMQEAIDTLVGLEALDLL